jgi:DNA-binding NtrC family response regulator
MTSEFSTFTLMNTRFEETRTHANEVPASDFHRFHSWHVQSRTILLISNDRELHESLRSSANEAGLIVVKLDFAVSTAEVLRAVRPSAVLLDLDLPDEAAWKSADVLLNEPDCPAVILLSGRTGHLAIQSAIRAGLLVSKGDSPDQILKIIEDALEMTGSDQAQRNTLRRELIRWLKPPAWKTDSRSAYRFWGINE